MPPERKHLNMNLTRRSLLGATAAAAIVGTVGCSAKPGDNAQPGGEAGDTIKLGLNYELSGPVATYGQASVLGINMAIAAIFAIAFVRGL